MGGAVQDPAHGRCNRRVLGIGAWLVINQQATAGIIIASSILTSRALAPVELAIAQLARVSSRARQSWRRLTRSLRDVPAEQRAHGRCRGPGDADGRSVSIMPARHATASSCRTSASSSRRARGWASSDPARSGKSSLARAIVGVWPPARGKIRLDGAALDQWSPRALGPHIGYLPQDMELFAGTVAREHRALRARCASEAVIAAAQAAGVHELILRLPDGYETQVGDGGAVPVGRPAPAHRRSRARSTAIPFLVVLDEPNSNLDARGRRGADAGHPRAFARAAASSSWSPTGRARSPASTYVLVMLTGRQQAFGPKEQVLQAPSSSSPWQRRRTPGPADDGARRQRSRRSKAP